ncbi:MAG: hypothetical protein M3Z24_04440 [Chloroflexota bacterium]|nr:hypothetical protein [Chloroflexota bacterium]
MEHEAYPYQVSIWVEPIKGSWLIDKPYWMEMCRCITENRARDIAECVLIRHRLVQVARLQGDHFEPIAWYPDKETVQKVIQQP